MGKRFMSIGLALLMCICCIGCGNPAVREGRQGTICAISSLFTLYSSRSRIWYEVKGDVSEDSPVYAIYVFYQVYGKTDGISHPGNKEFIANTGDYFAAVDETGTLLPNLGELDKMSDDEVFEIAKEYNLHYSDNHQIDPVLLRAFDNNPQEYDKNIWAIHQYCLAQDTSNDQGKIKSLYLILHNVYPEIMENGSDVIAEFGWPYPEGDNVQYVTGLYPRKMNILDIAEDAYVNGNLYGGFVTDGDKKMMIKNTENYVFAIDLGGLDGYPANMAPEEILLTNPLRGYFATKDGEYIEDTYNGYPYYYMTPELYDIEMELQNN